jgi:hypothetical protein
MGTRSHFGGGISVIEMLVKFLPSKRGAVM